MWRLWILDAGIWILRMELISYRQSVSGESCPRYQLPQGVTKARSRGLFAFGDAFDMAFRVTVWE